MIYPNLSEIGLGLKFKLHPRNPDRCYFAHDADEATLARRYRILHPLRPKISAEETKNKRALTRARCKGRHAGSMTKMPSKQICHANIRRFPGLRLCSLLFIARNNARTMEESRNFARKREAFDKSARVPHRETRRAR